MRAYHLYFRINDQKFFVRKNQLASRFVLYIDGILIGCYSRCRDAVRAYRQATATTWNGREVFRPRADKNAPAWIEMADNSRYCQYLNGLGFTTRERQEYFAKVESQLVDLYGVR